MKLISMVDFILDTHCLTTNKFCTKYNFPLPKFNNNIDKAVIEIMTIDSIKHRLFVEYAKLLNRNLMSDMFMGNNPLFPKCRQIDVSENKYLHFRLSHRLDIFFDKKGCCLQPHIDQMEGYYIKKISDLINLEIEINHIIK